MDYDPWLVCISPSQRGGLATVEDETVAKPLFCDGEMQISRGL